MSKREVSVLVPYRIRNNQYQYYLQKRTHDAPRHPNMYGLFGGGIKPGESKKAALLREIQEELTIEIVNPVYLGSFVGKTTKHHVYSLHVADDFGDTVTICEGLYGRFYSLPQILTDIPISPTNKKIVKELEAFLIQTR